MIARVSRMLGDFRGRILDVGCGKGVLGRLLPHLDLTGLDACFTLVQKATIGYRARVEAVAESLPFADASFDAVVSLNALHHIGDPPRAIQEIARVLRPGGPLITVDPRTVTAVELAKKLLRRGDPAYAPTHRSFGVEEYRELLTGGGAFQPPQIELVGCTALLFAGGMDSLKLSSRYEAIKTIFAGLIALDRALLSRAPFGALGLNIMARTTKA
jgi:SAM-dependent methyltransferase